MTLADQKCVPCHSNILPLTTAEALEQLKQLQPEWELFNGKKIKREFKFKDFVAAMVFVNQIARLAEEQNHHPDLYIFYNKVGVELWTHFIGGLHQNDFILAAKIERLA